MCDICPACKATGNKKGVPLIEVTPEMLEAGSARFTELLEAGVGSAYLVSEVYLAMQKAFAH